jgi:hypothetical protein
MSCCLESVGHGLDMRVRREEVSAVFVLNAISRMSTSISSEAGIPDILAPTVVGDFQSSGVGGATTFEWITALVAIFR